MQPRYELNAADLYIPSMAFVTYILVVGYMLGLQNRFSPEILATTASSALTALFLEILVRPFCIIIYNTVPGHLLLICRFIDCSIANLGRKMFFSLKKIMFYRLFIQIKKTLRGKKSI